MVQLESDNGACRCQAGIVISYNAYRFVCRSWLPTSKQRGACRVRVKAAGSTRGVAVLRGGRLGLLLGEDSQ